MRVLFVNENIGGHATVHHHLRQVLATRPDVDARLLDLPAPSGLERLAGVRIPGLARLDLDLQPVRAQLARSAGLARRLEVELGGIDAVHLYTHNAGLLSAAAWAGRPTVVSLDTTNAQNLYRLPTRTPGRFTALGLAAVKPFERRVYRAATTVVANSRWAADSLAADYGLDPDRVRIQPFGITAPDFGPGPAPGTRAPTRGALPRLVFVGRSMARKGGHQLLRVHRRCFRGQADLLLVTKDRVAAGSGVDVDGGLGVGDPRLWELLRSSACFVFPSEIDMAPNAVIEAMMAGLPVIARRQGALPEMVADGETGFLVGPGDDELARAIARLVADPELRMAMGSAARAQAIARYGAEATTDRLLAIIADAVERFGRREPA